MLDDLRHAVSAVWKSPAFAAVAILTLGLGIGANTATFAVVNAVVIRPLPFAEPERLVQLVTTNPSRNISWFSVSFPDYVDWKERSRSFETLGALRTRSADLTGDDPPEYLLLQYVTASYLPTLGVRPALGRAFEAEDDRPGRNRIVMLTDGLWRRRFGGDPQVIGRRIVLNGEAHTVVAVAPPIPGLEKGGDAFVPLGADLAREERDESDLEVFGRLAKGVTLEQAQAEMAAIGEQIGREHPESKGGWGVALQPLVTAVVGAPARKALLVLLGAVSLLVLIACANVSNLLLLRATTRSKEIAIRVAMGCGTGRLARHLLAESLVLSGLGGLAGVLLAFWIVEAVRSLGSAYLPRITEINVDVRVLAFTSLVAMVTGVLAGLAPVLQARGTDVQRALKEKNPTGTAGIWSARSGLVVAQMALSLVLLIGAGLLIRSLHRLSQVDLGLRIENVITFGVAPGEGSAAFFRQLVERAEALPGVQAVGVTSGMPFTAANTSLHIFAVGPARIPPTQSIQADWRTVDGGFFRALQIPLVRGRLFDPRDDRNGPRTVVVNETLALQLWGNEDPIGKRVNPGGGTDYSTVIGVVRDFRYRSPNQPAAPAFFFSAYRSPWGQMSVAVRTARPPELLVPELRALVKALDPGLPLFRVAALESVLAESVAQQRIQTALFGAFATQAAVLAGVGVYSLMAFTVAQRTKEIGVRMALGGSRLDIVRLLGRYGSRLAIPGLVIGLLAAAALARVLEGLLFEVSPWDPLTFASVACLLAALLLLACYLPARRAAGVDPMVVLREE